MVFLIVKFRSEIRGLIERIATLQFPGGGGLTTQQPQQASDAGGGKDIISPEVDDVAVPTDIQLDPAEREQLQDLIRAERSNAYLWEYRYLHFFLVRHTQEVLDWLDSQTVPVSEALFDSMWMPRIGTAIERSAVLGVLEQHHLIQIENRLITVTPKGKEYREWRGPLLPLAG